MKNSIKLILSAALLLILGTSCEKEETKVYFEGGTAPVLAASTTTLAVNPANKTANLVNLSWTNPNYNFTTGVSSQDVTYTIQLDTLGANFTNPKIQEVAVSKDLKYSFTVADFNNLLVKLELREDVPHDLELRVVSSINKAVPLNSNVIQFKGVIPYEDFSIQPPASNKLYIVGDATPAGWGNPVPEPSQQLTTIKKGLYEIDLQLNGAKFYLFLPVNGSWDTKYGALGANGTNNQAGDAFKLGGGDLKAPDASGLYKITVDFKSGKFTVKKL
jgi:hypothetical protein